MPNGPTPEEVSFDVALSIEEADLDDPAELPPDGDDSVHASVDVAGIRARGPSNLVSEGGAGP